MSDSAAIHKLADELWLHIFKFSTEASLQAWSRSYQLPSRSFFPTPFTLSAVSRHWRTVCLTNTSVWDSVYVRFPTYDIEYSDYDNERSYAVTKQFIAQVDAFQLWIGRAGTRNISIALSLREMSMSIDFAQEAAMRIPHIVVKHAKQIKDLNMVLSARWYPIFNGVHFPILKKLKLFVPEIWPWDRQFFADETDLFSVDAALDLTSCPQLWSIDVDGSCKEHNRITLPWAQIRAVHAGWVRPMVYPEILDLMPNIRRCSLDANPMYYAPSDFLEYDEEWFERAGRRQGEWALEDLKVTLMHPIAIKALLDHSPLSLNRIFLLPDNQQSVAHHLTDSVFLQSLTPFSATLNDLAIQRYLLRDVDALADALSQLTSLVSLDVYIGTEDRGLDDDFLAKTLCKSDVLPCIEKVSIQTTKLQFSEEVLELSLANRGYPSRKLASSAAKCSVIRALRFTGTDPNQPAYPLTPDTTNLFEGYIESGLRLRIGHMPLKMNSDSRSSKFSLWDEED